LHHTLKLSQQKPEERKEDVSARVSPVELMSCFPIGTHNCSYGLLYPVWLHDISLAKAFQCKAQMQYNRAQQSASVQSLCDKRSSMHIAQ